MDQCLEANNKKPNIMPLQFGEELRLACIVENLLSTTELFNLYDYTEPLLARLNEARRKKYIVIKNKKAVQAICKRWRLPQFTLDGQLYKFKSYWPKIEIIQWQHGKSLCDINFNSVTNNAYTQPNMLHYLISLNALGTSKTLVTDIAGAELEIALIGNRSLVWNAGHASLQEVRGEANKTQIYLHVLYEKAD